MQSPPRRPDRLRLAQGFLVAALALCGACARAGDASLEATVPGSAPASAADAVPVSGSPVPMSADEPMSPSPPLPSLPPEAGPAHALPSPPNCHGYAQDNPRWFDRAQGYFSQRACTPAQWFDRFFGRAREEDVASALVRVVPSVQYSERDFTDTGIRISARVNLPNLRDRFSVIVNGDEDENAGLLPGETQRPQQANAPGQSSSAALRYMLKLANRSGAEFDVGLRSQLKLFARARYHRTWVHDPVLQTRFTQSLYFRDGDGFGETSVVEVERMLAEDLLLRWSSQFTVSEAANGLEFRDGIQLFHQIDRDRAIGWTLAGTLRSDPAWQATFYDTSIRYRQRAFRPWFFFEVEPFIDALRKEAFHPNPGIAFRVEIWLGDDGRRPH